MTVLRWLYWLRARTMPLSEMLILLFIICAAVGALADAVRVAVK